MIKELLISASFTIFLSISVFAQEYSLNQVDQPPKLKKECKTDNSTSCFEKSVLRYIQKNIDITNLINGGEGTCYVQFTINEKGKISRLRSRSNSKALQKEAERLVKKMHIGEAAKIGGKPVSVIYTVPVKFNQQHHNSYEEFFNDQLLAENLPGINEVSQGPVFKSCEAELHCLKNKFKTRLLGEDYTIEQLRRLKISFVVNENAEIKIPLVITPNQSLQNSVNSILDELEIIKPAYADGKPISIRLNYQFEGI